MLVAICIRKNVSSFQVHRKPQCYNFKKPNLSNNLNELGNKCTSRTSRKKHIIADTFELSSVRLYAENSVESNCPRTSDFPNGETVSGYCFKLLILQ